jgi:ADP-ribose pyrophosphatase
VELNETVVGTEEIFSGRLLRLRVDTVRLPDGREARREVISHPGAVCVVPLRQDGQVLMVRQFRSGAGRPLLEVPAGLLGPGETPEQCAARELEEETGYRAGKLRLLCTFFLTPGYSSERMFAFLATDLTEAWANPDDTENLELVPVPLSDLERMLRMGELEDAKTVAALLMVLHTWDLRAFDLSVHPDGEGVA